MSYTNKIIKISKISIIVLIAFLSLVFSGLALAKGETLGSSGVAQHIPDCTDFSNCNDVSIFVVVAIGIARYLFGIIGALALVMFVYGGFVWITSRGSSEKVKKGMEIFTAAVLGLVIAFSAYMLVDYFSKNIIEVDPQYQLTPNTTKK